jgi:hypothetical protein
VFAGSTPVPRITAYRFRVFDSLIFFCGEAGFFFSRRFKEDT